MIAFSLLPGCPRKVGGPLLRGLLDVRPAVASRGRSGVDLVRERDLLAARLRDRELVARGLLAAARTCHRYCSFREVTLAFARSMRRARMLPSYFARVAARA